MATEFIIGFFIAAVASLVLTPIVIRLAFRIGALDKPDARKIHKNPIPRLGGLAVYAAFFISLIAVLNLDPTIFKSTWIVSNEGLMFVASLLIVLTLGVWDDLHALRPYQKFLIQLFLATVVYIAGFRITNITHPFDPGVFELGILSYPVTVLWIVGVTNAINLIDGLDGLAGGVSTIAAVTIAAIAFLGHDIGSAMIALLLAGSIIGFLPYNFSPARIFLGDSGSLFLGFTLAVLSIQGGTRASTAFAMVVPILALGFPIMDTLLAMIRRLFGSLLPRSTNKTLPEKLRSMFLPDKGHIHHKLIASGFSQKDAVLVLYVISLIFGLSAFAVTVVNNAIAAILLTIVGLAMVFGVRRLRYAEISIFKSGLLLPLYNQPLFNREAFRFFLDFTFVFVSAGVAMALSPMGLPLSKHFFAIAAFLAGPQLIVFWLARLHRRSVAHFGIGDSLAISKIVAGSVLLSALTLFALSAQFPSILVSFDATLFLVDFYLLLTFVLGSRISLHILKYISQRNTPAGRKAVIYGANANGMLILQKFLDSGSSEVAPLGFLDDNPKLEGKHLNGFPIFGGHWKIHSLARKMNLEEIFLCSDAISGEVMRRLRKASKQYRVRLIRPQFLFEDITHSSHEPAIGLPQQEVRSEVTQPALDPLVNPENRAAG
jgi:UDP-GlcNAc:undecaprenyl-phosphate GlcNAc-1-phosphate transferase